VRPPLADKENAGAPLQRSRGVVFHARPMRCKQVVDEFGWATRSKFTPQNGPNRLEARSSFCKRKSRGKYE